MHSIHLQKWCTIMVRPNRSIRILILTIALSLIMGGLAQNPTESAAPPGSEQPEDIDLTTYFDANSLLMFVTNTGSFAYDQDGVLGKYDGLYFPLGEPNTVMYASGLWLGARVDGEVRVTVSEYWDEYVPGPMSGGTFLPDDPSFRVYKINVGDTRASNPDYAGWPFDQGAPALKNHLGSDSLDSQGFRIPLLLGDQALWAVFNDADPARHTNDAGSTLPLGVEVQLYVYGDAENCPSGRTINLRYTIINKGGNFLEDAYVSFWADPDLGDAGDDLAGCDTLHSLAFAYNDSNDAIYGAAPPAVGFGLMQGPIVPSPGDTAWRSSTNECLQGFANLPMTAFSMYINGTDPGNTIQSYNYMRGLSRTGDPVINPTTGLVTKYMLSGDPVSGTGWIDESPADRRYLLNTGPFTMAPGDTQEVVMSVMVGQGTQRFGYEGDTVHATHVAGLSSGSAFAVILDETATTGHDYQITLAPAPLGGGYDWSVRDLTAGVDVITGWENQDGSDNYPLLDGLVVKLIGPELGVSDWGIPNGTRRFTWANADGFEWEGFNGAIGWGGPGDTRGFGTHDPVPGTELPRVLLKLAESDVNGNFNTADENLSYGYRYLRNCCDPAKPEFAPFILNNNGYDPYGFQAFAKNVPLSAWNIDVDPPQRLTVGFLENNVVGGLVDGKYWPGAHTDYNNTLGDGPREWLWIYLDDYSETADPDYSGSAINDPMPIMYWLTVNRRGDVPFAPGDEFLIIPATDFNTEADVFEFTAPDPVIRIASDAPSCWPEETLASVAALRRVDSVAKSQFGCYTGPGASLPVAVDDTKSARDGATLYFVGAGVLTNDYDPDGDALTAILDTDVSHGVLDLHSDGSLFYTPDPGFDGVDQFTYFANDGLANSVTPATVTLLVKSGGAVPPGDYDEDGTITAVDLAAQIEAIFYDGPDPTDGGCRDWPRGDVDCDGFSTSVDLSKLIDHLFFGGNEPCDPCSL